MLNNVPVPGQTLGSSRDLINANFVDINTAFSVNHVQINDGSGNQGKHRVVEFPQLSSTPSFLVNEIGLFNQNYTGTSRSELWLTRGLGTPVPISAYVVPNTQVNGWTYLASGALLIWGRSTTSAGTKMITYNNAPSGGQATFPTFAVAAVPQVTRYNSSGTPDQFDVYIESYGPLNFIVRSFNRSSLAAGGNISFTWFAVGI